MNTQSCPADTVGQFSPGWPTFGKRGTQFVANRALLATIAHRPSDA
jgi:hypothetical protein